MPTAGSIISSTYKYRLYVQLQTLLRQFNNTSGTWTSTGAQYLPYESCSFTPGNPVEDQPFKTGAGSDIAGVGGRHNGTFTINFPWIPSGAAGTKPNLDQVLVSIFGAAATVAAGVSVTYAFTDAINPLSFFFYDESGQSTPTNLYCLGALPSKVRWTFNGKFAMMSVDFRCVVIGSSPQFSQYTGVDAVAAGGLTTYPTEPGSFTTIGSTVKGFGGMVVVDSNTIGEVRKGLTVEVDTGYEWIEDGFADGYPAQAVVGKRKTSIGQLTVWNTDSAGILNMKAIGFLHTPVTGSITHNSVAGLISAFAFNQLQFPEGAFSEDGAVMNVDFNGAMAHATAAGLTNNFTLALT